MPPLDWARLATPEEDAEADGLALADTCGVTWVAGSWLGSLGR